MLYIYLVALCVLVVIYIGFLVCKSIENYIDNIPRNPLYTFNQKPVTNYPMYTTHENVDFKTLCPSQYLPNGRKSCNTNDDCGPAEFCSDLDSMERNCVCSIINKCLYDAVC